MSLASLNNPIVVSCLGIGNLLLLWVLERAISNDAVPFRYIQIASVVAYGLNAFATSRPGRIDVNNNNDAQKKKDDDMDTRRSNGTTLFAPDGWAFTIWGPIFLGELIFVLSQLFFVNESNDPVKYSIVQKVLCPFIVSQLFQVLWAASFRPKYKGKLMFISVFMLSGTAFSLSKAHEAYSTSSPSVSFIQHVVHFFPISLHFGWTTAASLVNLNMALAKQDTFTSPKAMANIGHISVVVATVVGVFISLRRYAPTFGIVICWAIYAVESTLKKRLEEQEINNAGEEKEKDNKGSKTDNNLVVGIYGAETQIWMCEYSAVFLAMGFIYAFEQLTAP